MLSHKSPQTRGKFSLSRYFQEFKVGDKVAVSLELSVPFYYPKKLQGRTGKIIKKSGRSYNVEIKDLNKPKQYLIPPIHLRRIEQ
jgi:ribosomal protein L21E